MSGRGRALGGLLSVAGTSKALPRVIALLVVVPALLGACDKGPAKPRHRERSAARDGDCIDPVRPHAFFYPAQNRTDYGPDHPDEDGCKILVPDHLFCCPAAARASDR